MADCNLKKFEESKKLKFTQQLYKPAYKQVIKIQKKI